MAQRTCIIPDCDKPARTRGWCLKHYTRWTRHGDPLHVERGPDRKVHTNGYVLVRIPDHPFAMRGGFVYEHRVVLLAKVGPGPRLCHWCQTPVEWGSTLLPDHVDNDRTNNDPANLVPSCVGCNTHRDNYKLRWTHCPNGHEYTPENQEASVTEHRKCLECGRERRARYERRRRARILNFTA